MYAGALGSFLNQPELALNAYEGLGGGRQYGSFIVASYFTEAVSRNFVLDTWRTIKEARGSVEGRVAPIEAIEQVVDFYGRDLNDLLLGFAVANYRLDTPSGATFFLGAQDGYDDSHARGLWRRTTASGSRPPRAEHTISQSITRSGSPEVAQGGATYVEFSPSSSGGRLTVDLNPRAGDYSYALLTWTPGAGRPNMAPLDMTRGSTRPIRTAELTVTLNQGERATLVIARTDVSTSPSTGPVHWNASMSQAPSGGSKIMVVGDSITHGNEGSHSWRYVLERHLRANGSSVDFVGPRIGTYDIHTDIRNRAILDGNEPPPQQYYPGPSTADYYNNNFDREHNAMWGWTFADANNTIRRDVTDYDADYLLIGLGFNDITWGYSDASGTVTSARRMIEEARAANPEIRVLISNVVTRTTLPGFEWLNPEIREYASLLGPAMQSLSTERSPVHVVDISSDFNPNLGAHTWDGVHPNSAGDYFIGAKFADAMHGRFGVGSPYGSLPSNPPDVQLSKVQGVRVGMTDQGFRISWNRVFGASGYLVWTRNVTEGESWRLLPLPVPGDYFHSTWLRTGEVHEFRVAAMRGDQQVGPTSDVASGEAAPRTVPGPANVRVQVDGTNGLVSWDARSSGARGYQVYWIEALGNYPIMRNAYVSGVSTDSYRITGLQPGMTYNVGVSSVNTFGPGIPTGTLNPVVVPGGTALTDEDALDITWEAEDESFLGTAELWDGYPEGVAPTTDAFPQDPGELEGEGTREERQHAPTGLPAREEDEG